jgi:excinuclease ABC subunit C
MSAITENFYRFYAPREIRVTQDFADRKKLARDLGERFARAIPINIITNSTRRSTTIRAARLARDEIEIDRAKPDASAKAIASELKGLFGLSRAPKRIECFDVAHISGRGFVAAWSTWIDGHLVGREYGFHISHETSELSTLSDAVLFRTRQPDAPDLIILDGGRPQMSAVLEKLTEERRRKFVLVAATKPPGKHSGIAYLLLESGDRLEFDETSPAHNLIKTLRDDAHDLANRVHRDLRDSSHNYELAAILPSLSEGQRREALKLAGSIARLTTSSDDEVAKMFPPKIARKIVRDLKKLRRGETREVIPLIVPIRFGDENGSADDLRPIHWAR